MVFTLVGYAEQQDASAALLDIAAIPDPHIRVVGDQIFVPALKNLAALYSIGSGLLETQLSTPSLLRLLQMDMTPVDAATEPTANPDDKLLNYFESPFPLKASEPMTARMLNGGNVLAFVLAWLSDGETSRIKGKIVTVKATAAKTLVANNWTNGALVFSQNLPAGRYAIVGARCFMAGGIAFRFVTPGSSWRPGALAYDLKSDAGSPLFRNGMLGIWDEFEHDAPPTVDFLSVSADTAEVVWLDLIQIRED